MIKLEDVHWLVPHPKGAFEDYRTGVRRQFACLPERDAMALHIADTFAATEDVEAATCPACRRDPRWQAAARATLGYRPHFVIADDGNCCG